MVRGHVVTVTIHRRAQVTAGLHLRPVPSECRYIRPVSLKAGSSFWIRPVSLKAGGSSFWGSSPGLVQRDSTAVFCDLFPEIQMGTLQPELQCYGI